MLYLDKTGEPVQEERWTWVAVYNDETTLVQFDRTDETYHYFDEIDKDKVVRFGLANHQTGKTALIEIPSGAKLIHYYDNLIQHPLGGTAIHHRLYCFGYQLGKDKKLLTVLPNDFIVEADSNKIGVL